MRRLYKNKIECRSRKAIPTAKIMIGVIGPSVLTKDGFKDAIITAMASHVTDLVR